MSDWNKYTSPSKFNHKRALKCLGIALGTGVLVTGYLILTAHFPYIALGLIVLTILVIAYRFAGYAS